MPPHVSSSMNGMYLSGKPGIVQAMQMPPTFGQPPTPLTQPRTRDVALHDRPLAAELDEAAVVVAVLGGEVALLGEAAAVAVLADRALEQPRRPQCVVERDHRREAAELQHEVQQRLGRVVRLRRAAGDVDDRDAGLRLPVPAEVVGAAPSRPSGCSSSPGCRRRWRRCRSATTAAAFGARRSIHSFVVIGWPVSGSMPMRRPVAVAVDLLVRDRALEDQHERVELAAPRPATRPA